MIYGVFASKNMSILVHLVFISGQHWLQSIAPVVNRAKVISENTEALSFSALSGGIAPHEVIGLGISANGECMGIKHLKPIFFVEPDGAVIVLPDPQPHIG